MAVLNVRDDEVGRLVATLEHQLNGIDPRAAMVVRKAAFDVERFAKRYAPVDTGFLRSSIHTELFVNNSRMYGADIIADAEYAGFVEHGTTRMAPHPYMAPAVQRVEPEFLAALAAIANPLEEPR